MPITLLEIPPSMTTADNIGEGEVIKELEQRGFQGLDTLSLEELQILTERKRKQLHLEAIERKAQLEGEISGIEQQIQDLGAKKVALTEELDALLKSLGLPGNGSERPARKKQPKVKKVEEAPPASPPET